MGQGERETERGKTQWANCGKNGMKAAAFPEAVSARICLLAQVTVFHISASWSTLLVSILQVHYIFTEKACSQSTQENSPSSPSKGAREAPGKPQVILQKR